MVQALRAHGRVRRPRVAVRIIFAGPDALGLLAGPAARGPPEPPSDHGGIGSIQRVVRPPSRRLQTGDRLGTRSPLDDGGTGCAFSRWRRDAPTHIRRRRLDPTE